LFDGTGIEVGEVSVARLKQRGLQELCFFFLDVLGKRKIVERIVQKIKNWRLEKLKSNIKTNFGGREVRT
jgi:hypothetical protein